MCRAVVAVVFGMACLLAVAPLPSQSEVLTSLIVDLASANGATLNADLNSDIEFSCNQAFAYKIYMVTKEAFDSCDLTIASRRVLTVADVCTPGGSVNRTLSPISDGVTNEFTSEIFKGFEANSDYYFISPTLDGNFNSFSGGLCASGAKLHVRTTRATRCNLISCCGESLPGCFMSSYRGEGAEPHCTRYQRLDSASGETCSDGSALTHSTTCDIWKRCLGKIRFFFSFTPSYVPSVTPSNAQKLVIAAQLSERVLNVFLFSNIEIEATPADVDSVHTYRLGVDVNADVDYSPDYIANTVTRILKGANVNLYDTNGDPQSTTLAQGSVSSLDSSQTTTPAPDNSSAGWQDWQTGAVVGGIVGGIVLVTAVLFVVKRGGGGGSNSAQNGMELPTTTDRKMSSEASTTSSDRKMTKWEKDDTTL